MDLFKLQALIEIDQGEFASHQLQRYKDDSPRHSRMERAAEWLIAEGYCDGGNLTSLGTATLILAVASFGPAE